MMLLENRLLGNIRVFLEILFQIFRIGFARRRVVTHASPFNADPFLERDSCGALRSHCYFKSAWATLAAGSRTLSSFSSD